MLTLSVLRATHARDGRIDWIGLRPARRAPMRTVEAAEVTADGLTGDHGRAGPRAVTLIQAEHLPAIAALCSLGAVDPSALRRNLVISGLNLSALRGADLAVGGGA